MPAMAAFPEVHRSGHCSLRASEISTELHSELDLTSKTFFALVRLVYG